MVTIEGGKVHIFDVAAISFLPIWEKEPGVFVTVKGEDPTETLRKSLKGFDAYSLDRKTKLKRIKALRLLLDLSTDTSPLPEEFAEKLKEADVQAAELEVEANKLDTTRVELCEFMAMCGVNPTEEDTSAKDADSFLKKMTGNKPEEGQ
jgi:hypothetical protein